MEKGIGLSSLIHQIRGRRVMLSADLARLYAVPPKALVQAVNRNKERFPKDFCFQLSLSEFRNLKSQIVTSSWGGVRRALPYAFTEQGVAMLSSVLRSKTAIRANIAIMRAFVKARELAARNWILLEKLTTLETRVDRHEHDIGRLIDALLREPAQADDDAPLKDRKIGFLP
jgi:hypothetical protein